MYNTLLEKGIDPPELLFPLLRRCARDPVASVRAALLDHLPYLTSRRHVLGWQLFRDIFRESQTIYGLLLKGICIISITNILPKWRPI